MARFILFDKKQYSKNTGLIPLRRGDDWLLEGKIQDSLPGNYYQDVDLTSMSATAYFPGASGDVIAASVTPVDAVCGRINIGLDRGQTPSVNIEQEGIGIYLVLDTGSQLQTVETIDQVLEILDRQFPLG